MSHPRRFLVAGLALALVALAPGRPAAAAPSDSRLSLSGERVHVYNLAGSVDIVAAPGTAVLVEPTYGGKDAARIDVQTLPGAEPSLIFRYPGNRIVYRRSGSGFWSNSKTSLDVGADGRFGDDWGKNGLGLGRRKVVISTSGDGLEAWTDLRISIPRGQKAALHLGVGDVTVANVDGELRVDSAAGSVDAHDTKGWLDVDTGAGEVALRDAAGRVSVDTGSGGVSLINFSGTDVDIDTGSGSVKMAAILATRRVGVDTGSGRVEIVDVRSPKVGVDTGSGRVYVRLGAGVDDLAVDTGSGSVTVEAPASLDATVRLETGSGGLDVSGFALSSVSRDDDSLRATIGQGRGRIVLETGSGRIRLARV